MRTFRRRSRARAKEPVFWFRHCFAPEVSLATGSPAGCDQATVQNVDQLATGGITFTGFDEEYTCRRIRFAMCQNADVSSLSTDHQWNVILMIVKTSTTALAPLVGQLFHDVMTGGSAAIPAAMDVLAIKQFSYVSFAGSRVVQNMNQDAGDGTWDIKVARRLDADESIALLSGGYTLLGDSFPSASGSKNTFNIISSILYSRTLRRR